MFPILFNMFNLIPAVQHFVLFPGPGFQHFSNRGLLLDSADCPPDSVWLYFPSGLGARQ